MALFFISTIFLIWSSGSVTIAYSDFTCTYYKQNNRIDCWDNSQAICSGYHLCASCSTQDLSADQEAKGFRHLQAGKYLVGPFREKGEKKTPWFDLYQQKQDGNGNWDFHTKNPENECHGDQHGGLYCCRGRKLFWEDQNHSGKKIFCFEGYGRM